MSKNVIPKIGLIVFLMSIVGIGSIYFVVRNEYIKIAENIAPGVLTTRYDKITKALSEDKFESIGPIEFDKMFKEHGTTYDHKIVWNVVRVRHSLDNRNLYIKPINGDDDSGEGLIFLEKDVVDSDTHRNGIVPLEHKEVVSTLKEGDLVYISWKNIQIHKYSGVSILDTIRKASTEEIIQYLEVERRFDEEAYGPYEEPDYKRLLYKLNTHNFEKVGATSHDNISHYCDNLNNYKMTWALMKYKEPFKEGAKFNNIKREEGFPDSCFYITPEIFRTEHTPSCLILPELESSFKDLPQGSLVYTSWKNVRVHKNYCFYVLNEVRFQTPEELKQYEDIFTTGSSSKEGRYAKFYK